MHPSYDPALARLVEQAIEACRARMSERAPTLGRHFDLWLDSLTGGRPPASYFTHPDAFPLVLLPWWMEIALRGEVELGFHSDVVRSSVNGYLFVRLIDDSMDADAPPPEVMPAVIVLHAEFQHSLSGHFAAGHAFWDDFFAASYEAAETAAIDAAAETVDRAAFLATSSRKVSGVRIPLAAVAHQTGRADALAAWSGLVDALGRWHQMRNDVFGWRRDLEAGVATYFLSEARRHSGSEASPTGWILRDGLAWARSELDAWMEEALAAAGALGPPGLIAYLGERRRRDDERWRILTQSAAALDQLSARFSASQRSASASDQPLRRA